MMVVKMEIFFGLSDYEHQWNIPETKPLHISLHSFRTSETRTTGKIYKSDCHSYKKSNDNFE